MPVPGQNTKPRGIAMPYSGEGIVPDESYVAWWVGENDSIVHSVLLVVWTRMMCDHLWVVQDRMMMVEAVVIQVV